MNALKSFLSFSLFPALIAAWLGLGLEGAGNVLLFLAWLMALVLPFGLAKKSISEAAAQPEQPQPFRHFRSAKNLACIGTLVWFGHFGLASLLAWSWACIEIRERELKVLREKAAMPA